MKIKIIHFCRLLTCLLLVPSLLCRSIDADSSHQDHLLELKLQHFTRIRNHAKYSCARQECESLHNSYLVVSSSPIQAFSRVDSSGKYVDIQQSSPLLNNNECEEMISPDQNIMESEQLISIHSEPAVFQMNSDTSNSKDSNEQKYRMIYRIDLTNVTDELNFCKQMHIISNIMDLDSSILFLQPNYHIQISQIEPPAKPVNKPSEYHSQRVGPDLWHLGQIGNEQDFRLRRNYDFKYTGKGIRVHVLDTGVNLDHEEFEGRAELFFVTDDLKNDCPDNLDCHGHGSHVAGTVAGRRNGVAKQAHIYATKVLNSRGSGSTAGVIKGIEAVTGRPDAPGSIIVMSLGGPEDQAMRIALYSAFLKNITVVVAAGNNHGDACQESPSDSQHVITVGSHGREGVKSVFSNYGNCVDIYAPGEGIHSAVIPNNNSYGTKYGTSMATPVVAGIVATWLEENPNLSPSEIKRRLKAHAKKTPVSSVPHGTEQAVYAHAPISPCKNDETSVCLSIKASIGQHQDTCSLSLEPTDSTESELCALEFDENWPQWNQLKRYHPVFYFPFRAGKVRFGLYRVANDLKVHSDLDLLVNGGLNMTEFGELVLDVHKNQTMPIEIGRHDRGTTEGEVKPVLDFIVYAQVPRHCQDVVAGQTPCNGRGSCNLDTGLCECNRGYASFDCSETEWQFKRRRYAGWWYKTVFPWFECKFIVFPVGVSLIFWGFAMIVFSFRFKIISLQENEKARRHRLFVPEFLLNE